MKQFILILIFVIIGLNIKGQFSPDLKSTSEKITIHSIQRSFDQWSKSKDLANVKGWKYFMRWSDYYSQRLSSDGSMPIVRTLLEEAKKYNDLKEKMSLEDAIWVPAGPNLSPKESVYQRGIGRINCVAFHPTDPKTLWVGVAQGGIWKTTNGGESWLCLNNNLPILRISHIAVDPTNPDIIYVCLGDFAYLGYSLLSADKVRQTHFGIGIYKTNDGGSNWTPTGLSLDNKNLDYSLLKKVIINPKNTNQLIAAGIEGIWVSNDAGATWEKKLETMISDLEIDPFESNTLYAGSCYIRTLNDGNAGVYKSTDFGLNWSLLNTGIEQRGSQRIEIAIASSNSNYVYAIANNLNQGFKGLYRSKDKGISWELMTNIGAKNIFGWYNGVNEFGGQSNYDMMLSVDPSDENTVYAGAVNLWASKDGGVNWKGVSSWTMANGPSIHADQHSLEYNKLDDKFYICNDGGIMRTDTIIPGDWDIASIDNNYKWPSSWEYISDGMQITSFYRIGISQTNDKFLIGGAQDNSTYFYNGTEWSNIYGGDGMECIIKDDNPYQMWASSQYGSIGYSTDGGVNFISLERINESNGWTTPFIYNSNLHLLYIAGGNLYQSGNNGINLTRKSNFPIIPALNSTASTSSFSQCKNYPNTIYLAKRLYHLYNVPSELWITEDGGQNWSNITAGLPSGLYFTSVVVDGYNNSIAWITLGGFEEGKKVFKTVDKGKTWINISNNLPNIPINNLKLDIYSKSHVIYVATDLGVYYLSDLTNEWKLWGNNLPNVICSELEINYNTKQLYVATFGRGIWKAETYIDPAGYITTNSVEIEKYEFSCKLFPSPNHGAFKIEFTSSINSKINIEIINIMGATVYEENINVIEGVNLIPINQKFKFGQYFVRVSNSKGSKVLQFIAD